MLLTFPGESGGEADMPANKSGQVTELLRHWKQGDERALDTLLRMLYKELQWLAHYYLQSKRPDHALQTTALVHDVYLPLVGSQSLDLQNRERFIAVASRFMRRILVDYAGEHRASKRESGCRIAFEYLDALAVKGDAELLALDDALNELSAIDEGQGKIVGIIIIIKTVEMKFFGGCRLRRYRECWGPRAQPSIATGLPPGSGCIGR